MIITTKIGLVMFKYTFVFLMLSSLSRCETNVNVDDLFPKEINLETRIYKKNNNTICKTIAIDSIKISKLRTWFEKNSSNWKIEPTTFAVPPIDINGTNFNLMIFDNFVVLNYKDLNGKEHMQCTKRVSNSEFDFLTKY